MEIKTVIKSPPQSYQRKNLVPSCFTADFYQTFKKELIPILLKPLKTIEMGGILANKLLLGGQYHFNYKPRKRYNTERELYVNIHDEHRRKILHKILAN